jgi:ethanolamine transporter EutH
VVLAVAVTLTRPDSPEPETAPASIKRFSVLPLLLIFVGLMLLIVMIFTGFSLVPVTASSVTAEPFRDVFWGTRQADILAQIILILVGAFSVVILFKESE